MRLKKALKELLPTPALEGMRIVRDVPTLLLQKIAQRCGYNISRSDDYYSPLPSVSELRKTRNRWCNPSALRGITYKLNEMKSYLTNLVSKYGPEFGQLPPYSQVTQFGFGPGYTRTDAFVLYTMIRDRKPSLYLEVGSGVSTYYCSAAAEVNAREGHPLRIKCIEPNPYKALRDIPGIECYEHQVQDIDLSVFAELSPNDVLFIDSSHVLRLDGDVPYLYLEILPALGPGVVVHVHDVPFPFNIPYPPELWVFGDKWPMLWNEAMVLAGVPLL